MSGMLEKWRKIYHYRLFFISFAEENSMREGSDPRVFTWLKLFPFDFRVNRKHIEADKLAIRFDRVHKNSSTD